MGTGVRAHEALDRVERSCTEATTGHELFERLSADMHDLVPHDSSLWFGADPVTLLVSSPIRVEGMAEAACDPFWHNEFHVQDTLLFVDLARSAQPSAALRLTLDDRPARSTRFRELLAPLGYDDELRSVFRVGENTWGMLGLYRERGRPAFSADEVDFVSRVSTIIGTALREHVRVQSGWLGSSAAPGLVVFDDRSRVVSANEEALGWLRALVPEGREPELASGLPVPQSVERLLVSRQFEREVSPLWALLNRSRAVGCGIDGGATRLRVRDQQGRWLVLHGSCLTGREVDEPQSVAIVIEPAKSSEVAPIIIEAYSLTPRERDVVGALARGDSTSEIAASLFLSPHTVRDHIKTLFDKIEVSSRAELVARLYAEHYVTPAHADLVHL